jgi:hypothetical protein
VSSFPPTGRPLSRVGLALSIAALVAVTGGFAWAAVESFNFIHGSLGTGISNLKAVKVTGPQQTLFSWRRQACEPRDIPDAPARAFRDAAGQVHLIASHYVSRQSVGPNLNRVKHRCAVIMQSDYNPDPSKFEDKEWILAPYTTDGKTVYALVHDEYQGNTHPGRCASGIYLRCWYNAVTLAVSTDGGQSFRHARPPPGNLVAEVPYRYQNDAGRVGIFTPSNIVVKDGYYYSLVSAPRYRAQHPGTCVIRTKRLADPKSWRAWGGDGFDVTFVDPYTPGFVPRDHLCEPVSLREITDMTQSLTYNTYFKKYLLVAPAGDYDGRKRRNVYGFYYSLSGDLIHWSKRKLIREAALPPTYRCGESDPVFYPSVLDPGSKSRNFRTTGRRPYLYFTRFHYKSCNQTLDRDLVRVPIEFSK